MRRPGPLPVQAILLLLAAILAVRLAMLRPAASFLLRPDFVGAAIFLYAPFLHYRRGRTPGWLALGDAAKSARVLVGAAAAAGLVFYLYTRIPAAPLPPPPPGPIAPSAALLLRQALLVALPEEVFFRGYLYDAFEEKGWEPILSTSVFFCAAHLAIHASPYRALTFFPGLLLGWSRRRTGNLYVPVLLHFAFNLFALLRGVPG